MMYPSEPLLWWTYEEIDELLLWATEQGMSDLKLFSGGVAWMRLYGEWRAVTKRKITADELFAALEKLTRNNSVAAMLKSSGKDYDFAHQIQAERGVRKRFRANATAIANGYSTGVSIVFRAIPNEPPTIEELEVEEEILDAAFPSNGLVLITGVMGSGKSTLLAGMLRKIIEDGGRNIATYEAPIEFDFSAIKNAKSPITQSSVPEHLSSFLSAVRNCTRTAPDVVLIGESRDPETLRGMIESAEIGVAAYSTVHTRSVPETISRIINVFPSAERLQITATLLASLRLIISQRLLPDLITGKRIALKEYLAFTPDIRDELLETKPENLIQKTEILLTLKGQTIQQAAEKVFKTGRITENAYKAIVAERTNYNQKGECHE